MNWLHMAVWSPYVVGIGIGILTALTFLFSNKALACSTTFARAAGLIESAIHKEKALSRPYFVKVKPKTDWQWFLVIGIFIGSFLSARLSGSFHWGFVHDWWSVTVSTSPVWRLAGGFLGGVLLGFGARWVGGCTSGHGISGMIQLSVSSLVAVICFFAGGIATAFLMTHLFM